MWGSVSFYFYTVKVLFATPVLGLGDPQCSLHGIHFGSGSVLRRSDVLKLLGFGSKGDVKTGGFLKLC